MLTLPGFIYLMALFVWFQLITKENISFNTIQYTLKDNSFYASVIILVFSYAIGIIVHLAEQFILHFIRPSSMNDGQLWEFLTKNEKKSRGNYYLILIMVRHLIVSTTLFDLGFIFLLSQRSGCVFLPAVNLFYITVLTILILAYLHIRSIINRINNNGKKVKDQLKDKTI